MDFPQWINKKVGTHTKGIGRRLGVQRFLSGERWEKVGKIKVKCGGIFEGRSEPGTRVVP